MNWLNYLLEANIYLAVFYAFYRIFLHRETFYQMNRYFLLSTSALAFLLPLFQIGYLNGLSAPAKESTTLVVQFSEELPVAASNPSLNIDIIFLVYLLITGFFLFRLCASLFSIFQMSMKGKKVRAGNIIQVHFNHAETAFSFFNLLFINPRTEKQDVILLHEMIHIRQRHSIDILFFEILAIVNWFNPVCWLMKKDIKLIHEYIADEATTSRGFAKHEYALFLIHNSFGPISNPLASQIFNQSILRNRISMLNKKRSAGRARLRLLYVLPLTAGMLCATTLGFAKDYALVDLYSGKPTSPIALQEPRQQAKTEKKKRTYRIESRYDAKTGNDLPIKLVVINGKISKAVNFDFVDSYDQVRELNSSEAVAKYGKRAINGAVEFTGKNAGISIKFPPPIATKSAPRSVPIRKSTNIKFPPPMVKPAPATPKHIPEEQIKFPAPVVKPLEKYDETSGKASNTAKLNVGPNPLYIIDGKPMVVRPGDKKIVKFTAKSLIVHDKNNVEAIRKYGELAINGVIELEDGVVFYVEQDSIKKQ